MRRFVRTLVLAGVDLRDLRPYGVEFQNAQLQATAYEQETPLTLAWRKLPDLVWTVRGRPGALPEKVYVEVTGSPTCQLIDCLAWETLTELGQMPLYLCFDYHGRLVLGPVQSWWQAVKAEVLASGQETVSILAPILRRDQPVELHGFHLLDDLLYRMNFNPRTRPDDYEVPWSLLHQIDRDWARYLSLPEPERRAFRVRYDLEPPAEPPDWWPFAESKSLAATRPGPV